MSSRTIILKRRKAMSAMNKIKLALSEKNKTEILKCYFRYAADCEIDIKTSNFDPDAVYLRLINCAVVSRAEWDKLQAENARLREIARRHIIKAWHSGVKWGQGSTIYLEPSLDDMVVKFEQDLTSPERR